MAKFSTLSLTTVPSLPSCPTKLRTTFSLGHNQLQLLPVKFRYAPQQFNKGRNMRTAPATITGDHRTMPENDDFPIFSHNGELKSTDYTPVDNVDGLFMKYKRPKGGDQPLKGGRQLLKDGQKVEVEYLILDQKRNFIKQETKTITVGNKDLGSVFDMAIRHMSAGEAAIFVIPRNLGPLRQRLRPGKENRYYVYDVTSVNVVD